MPYGWSVLVTTSLDGDCVHLLVKIIIAKKRPPDNFGKSSGGISPCVCLQEEKKAARGSWRIASMRRRRPKATKSLSLGSSPPQ